MTGPNVYEKPLADIMGEGRLASLVVPVGSSLRRVVRANSGVFGEAKAAPRQRFQAALLVVGDGIAEYGQAVTG
jgi:hypothetical protein